MKASVLARRIKGKWDTECIEVLHTSLFSNIDENKFQALVTLKERRHYLDDVHHQDSVGEYVCSP